MYNHIEGLRKITTKTGLVKSLKEYYKNNSLCLKNKYEVFDSTPTTFIIKIGDNTDDDYSELLQRYKEISQGIFYKERMPEKYCMKNMWIVKPSDLNQGYNVI